MEESCSNAVVVVVVIVNMWQWSFPFLGRGARQESQWAIGEFLVLNKLKKLFQLDRLDAVGPCLGSDWKVVGSSGWGISSTLKLGFAACQTLNLRRITCPLSLGFLICKVGLHAVSQG